LHDIGKTKIPIEVLNKKGRLTDEEFAVIKTHTTLGYRILEKHNIPQSIKLAALSHHEKINGKGYPLGMAEDKIDALAKIVSICDIYDAMTANRIYRPKLCPFEVIRTFERSVYGELDTEYLLIFLKNIATTYLDCPVKLSDGRAATVIFINKLNLSRPIVRLDNGEMLDLSQTDDIVIAEML
jgi:HD-GYP domain-containing protein (c-di-GMP phosphodiesterase class II)